MFEENHLQEVMKTFKNIANIIYYHSLFYLYECTLNAIYNKNCCTYARSIFENSFSLNKLYFKLKVSFGNRCTVM